MKFLISCQFQSALIQQWRANDIPTVGRIDRIESHRTEYVPCRHLTAVIIFGISRRSVVVQRIQNMADILLSLPRLTCKIIEISYVMAGPLPCAYCPTNPEAL